MPELWGLILHIMIPDMFHTSWVKFHGLRARPSGSQEDLSCISRLVTPQIIKALEDGCFQRWTSNHLREKTVAYFPHNSLFTGILPPGLLGIMRSHDCNTYIDRQQNNPREAAPEVLHCSKHSERMQVVVKQAMVFWLICSTSPFSHLTLVAAWCLTSQSMKLSLSDHHRSR